MIENSSSTPFSEAAALLETAAGMLAIFGASDAGNRAAPSKTATSNRALFIAQILRVPAHDGKGRSALRICRCKKRGLVFRTRFCGGIRGIHRRKHLPAPALPGAHECSARSPARSRESIESAAALSG